MAHFAQLNDQSKVIQVCVVDNSVLLDAEGLEHEALGIAYLRSIFGQNTQWRQTSYNNRFRVRYAGLGMQYNEMYDAFIPMQPGPDWVFDHEQLDWKPISE